MHVSIYIGKLRILKLRKYVMGFITLTWIERTYGIIINIKLFQTIPQNITQQSLIGQNTFCVFFFLKIIEASYFEESAFLS